MIVSVDEYNEDKKRFFAKHNFDYECETIDGSGSAEYYRKVYSFADGATWYEVMLLTYINVPLNIPQYYVTIDVNVALMKTEYWSSDNADSKVWFEKWNTHKKAEI